MTKKHMNYILAKQLKDKGFPQEGEQYIDLDDFISDGESKSEMELCHLPTVSDLIEECGKESILVITVGRALSSVVHGTSGLMCNEATLEKALVKLWLELNK